MSSWLRRAPAIGAVLILVATAIVVFRVIPPVRADRFLRATPDRAANGFRVIALIGCLIVATATVASCLRWSRDSLRRQLTGPAGFVAILIGVLLIFAAGSFSGHGPEMRGTVIALWACVGLYLTGGLVLGVSAILPRRAAPEQS